MSLEVIGSVGARRESELIAPSGAPLQPEFVRQLAGAYERSLLDAVQLGQTASSVDAVVLAQAVLGATQRLRVLVTLPPGVVDPVTAARSLATLATLYPGRVAARIPETADGGALQAEYTDVLDALWRSPRPVERHGGAFAVSRQWSVLRPEPAPAVVIHLGTDHSGDARLAGVGDVYVVPADAPAEVATRIRRLRELTARPSVRFGVAIRPVVGHDRAELDLLCDRLVRVAPARAFGDGGASGRASDRRTALAAMTRAYGSAEPFVSSVDGIAARLHEYWRAGVEVFHLRGFDPAADVTVHSAVVDRLRTVVDAELRSEELAHDVA